MKIKYIILATISLLVAAGCSTTDDDTTYITVHEGMSRDVLRTRCGEPLRIEPGTSGGEDWYYRFSAWQTQPTGSSGRTDDFGQQTSTVSAGLSFSKEVVESPVHVSPDGYVVPPLPKGKVVKN